MREKNTYYNNMKNFRLDLITAPATVSHQKQPKRPILPKSHLGPITLKFRKRAISEKERRENVGYISQKCKSKRCVLIAGFCAYCSTETKVTQSEMDVA